MVPFCTLYFRVSLLKPSRRKKGTLIAKGLLRNLALIKEYILNHIRDPIIIYGIFLN